MNNQLQTLIKKKTYKNRAFNEFGEIPWIWRNSTNLEKFHEFGELIPSKSQNFVEDCQLTKNLLGSLAHPFDGSLAHLFFFWSLAHPFK